MIKEGGGDHAYLKKAFGDLPAFLYLWTAFINFMPVGVAVMALTGAEYMIKPFYPCEPPVIAVQLLACCIVFLISFINSNNAKTSTRLIDSLSVCKIIALLFICAAGIYNFIKREDRMKNFENMFQGSIVEPGPIAFAMCQGLFSYSGFNYLNVVANDLSNPKITLKLAIWISMPLVILTYVLNNSSILPTSQSFPQKSS